MSTSIHRIEVTSWRSSYDVKVFTKNGVSKRLSQFEFVTHEGAMAYAEPLAKRAKLEWSEWGGLPIWHAIATKPEK